MFLERSCVGLVGDGCRRMGVLVRGGGKTISSVSVRIRGGAGSKTNVSDDF